MTLLTNLDVEDSIERFKNKIMRKAIVLKVGGIRPSEDPLSSWFGKVNVCENGEDWPMSNGKPMIALAQINLSKLPWKPKVLTDIAFITVFIDNETFPCDDETNGNGWALREYKTTDNLVPIQSPETGSTIKPFQLNPEEVIDYPNWEDVPVECSPEIADKYYDLFQTVDGFKFGGWPTLIQGEIFLIGGNDVPDSPEFVFQIDTETKANWQWGDGGVGYFGLSKTEDGTNVWAFEWQCY